MFLTFYRRIILLFIRDRTSMRKHKELSSKELCKFCDLKDLDFETTDDLDVIEAFVGQERVEAAVTFGINMKRDGYNIFALGLDEADRQKLIRHFLKDRAKFEDGTVDWCYINNFTEHHKPVILKLPPGKGIQLREAMNGLINDLFGALTTAFESEEYQNRHQVIEDQNKNEESQLFNDLSKKAQERGFALIKTPAGFAFAPEKNGEILSPEEIDKLTDKEQAKMEGDVEELQKELQKILRQLPGQQREFRKQKRELNREIARYAVNDLIEEIRKKFNDQPAVNEFLDKVLNDIVENVRDIIGHQAQSTLAPFLQGGEKASSSPQDNPILSRYKINVIVDNSKLEGVPIIYEDNPTYKNLIGKVEYEAHLGALTTDFNLIKAGALHRANGGYLVLDARKVLLEPYTWEGLKRVLKSGKLRIESPGESYGLISTVSLEPEPIDVDVKVILMGERRLYYLLCTLDPEFSELFKVEADFDYDIDRNPGNQMLYSRMLGGLIRENELRSFRKDAIGRVIEESSRIIEDNEKMSLQNQKILDLLRESDFWAGRNKHDHVSKKDVQKAIEERHFRSERMRDKVIETIFRKTIYIDVEGEKTGQLNGLSVVQIGNTKFGQPSRITARVQMGKGEVINIEREVDLSGPIHSKGVLILSGFIGGRYSVRQPFSLSASLVFEQSYGGIDGDSASAAELFVLLSAISEIPLKQSFAVTGSINQHGVIQPIGGVNEKVEGFFDVCSKSGLTGEQGVIIPKSNVKNLMLREDVIKAVKNHSFHIYPIEHVDEGMELLTGLPMGEQNGDGIYPENTINRIIDDRLTAVAEQRKIYSGVNNGRKPK